MKSTSLLQAHKHMRHSLQSSALIVIACFTLLFIGGCDSSGSNSGGSGYVGTWFSSEAGNDTGDGDQSAYLDITESMVQIYVIEGGDCTVLSAEIANYDQESNVMEFEGTLGDFEQYYIEPSGDQLVAGSVGEGDPRITYESTETNPAELSVCQ